MGDRISLRLDPRDLNTFTTIDCPGARPVAHVAGAPSRRPVPDVRAAVGDHQGTGGGTSSTWCARVNNARRSLT